MLVPAPHPALRVRLGLGFALALVLGVCFGAGRASASDLGDQLLGELKRGLKAEDLTERRRAVGEVGYMRAHLDEAQKRRATVLLRKAFDDEPDLETRQLMVRSLARLGSTASWVPVILAAFGDRDPAVRETAYLEVLGGRRTLLDVVARLLEEDEDPTFRARLLLLLGDRRRHDAMPLLIERLGDEQPRVAAAAAEALEAISGQALGYDAALWSRWYARWEKAEAARVRSGAHHTVEGDGEPPAERPPPHVTRGLVPSFFGLRLAAKDIVFVIDVSGSVGAGGLQRVRTELVQAIERLGSDVHVAVLFFAEEMKLFKPELVLATPDIKGEIAYFLRGVAPGRKTDVFTPLHAGLALVRQRVAAKEAAGEPFRMPVTLVVVSDGRNNVDNTPFEVVEDKLGRLDLQRTVVHAVVVGGEPDPLMLHLAKAGGGEFKYIK